MPPFSRLICRRLDSARINTPSLSQNYSSQVAQWRFLAPRTGRARNGRIARLQEADGPSASTTSVTNSPTERVFSTCISPRDKGLPSDGNNVVPSSASPGASTESSPSDADGEPLFDSPNADFASQCNFFSVRNVDRIKEIRSSPSYAPRFSDYSVVLTGGTSGIGFAIAQELLCQGVQHLILATRNATSAIKTIHELSAATGRKSIPVSFYCHGDMEQSKKFWQDLDFNVLINCAGVTRSASLLAHSEESIAEQWRINYHLPVQLTKLMLQSYTRKAIRAHRDAKEGQVSDDSERQPDKSWCVVNISSLLANKGGAGASQYAATKAALNAFTRAMTIECKELWLRHGQILPPIRMNAVLPGYIQTKTLSELPHHWLPKLKQEIPLQAFGTCSEVAHAVTFLIENQYANNCVLNLDGGLSAV